MAESILAVVEKLTNLLADEARLLKGVKDKVEILMKQLNLMQAVVKDADAKHGGNEAYNCWLSQIRDLGYQAVDAIETYRNDSESSSLFNLMKKSLSLHSLDGEIDKIQSSLEVLFKMKDGFSITPNTNPEVQATNARRLRTWREPPAIMKEDDYIDLVEDTKVLLTQLSSIDPRETVVSIIGMGGLGKTTLANKLYNHTKLKFECKAFISVSKEYKRKEILYRILEAVYAKKIDQSDKEEENEVILKVHSFLKEKKYLVVLDDLWEKEDWDNLKEAFPNGMGCKVMLTTRNREVAKHAGCVNPLEPRLLKDHECLELLRKLALPQHPQFPNQLKELGLEMVKKCGGLPLAVVVLGGLLSGKDPEQWEIVNGNSRWRIMNDESDRVSLILSLSYKYLPFHLKLCFQHLGLFPEDYSVPKKELIRMWVAERFLPQQGEDTEEAVAETCIYELISKSMVLVGTRTSRGRVKAIRIHDVLRDFSISKAMEGKFLQIYSGKEVGTPTSSKIESRRLAIHGTYNDYAFLGPHTTHLRSLHFFSRVNKKMDFVYKNSKLLSVLDVYGSAYQGTQDYKVLENLTQLRYLAFKGNTHMVQMPSSFGKLLNLQTLDLRHCVIMHLLPDVLWKMKRLRHLLLNSKNRSRGLRLDTLIHLLTLTGVDSGRWLKLGLVKMVHMRQLGLSLMSVEDASLCFSSVCTLHNLQSLSLKMYCLSFPPILEQLSNCVHLQKLYLEGEIKKLPGAHEFPPNLMKLSLIQSKLNEDSIATLEKLPRLKMLIVNDIDGSKDLRELLFSSEGFPQLEVLHLQYLFGWKGWTVEHGAMMNIKHIKIQDCADLAKVSEGFKSLTTLEKIEFVQTSSFARSLQNDQDLVAFMKKYSIKLIQR